MLSTLIILNNSDPESFEWGLVESIGNSEPLAPGSVAIYRNKRLETASLSSPEDLIVNFGAETSCGVRDFSPWVQSGSAIKTELENLSGEFKLAVMQQNPAGEALRTFPIEGFAFPFEIEIEDDQGKRLLPPMFSRPIWSGISWSVNRFAAEGLRSIKVTTVETQEARLMCELFRTDQAAEEHGEYRPGQLKNSFSDSLF